MKKSEGIVQSDRTLSSKARVPLGLLYWPLGFLRLDGGWTGEERGQEIRKALSSPCRLQRTPCFGSCYRRTAVLSVSLKDSESGEGDVDSCRQDYFHNNIKTLFAFFTLWELAQVSST